MRVRETIQALTTRFVARRATLALAAVMFAALVAPTSASAYTIMVNTTADRVDGIYTGGLAVLASNPGGDFAVSLREAVLALQYEGAPAQFIMQPGVYVLEDELTVVPGGAAPTVYGGTLEIHKSVTIVGGGVTITPRMTADPTQLFDVDPMLTGGVAFTASSVTFLAGRTDGWGGGAILAGDSPDGFPKDSVTLTSCTFTNNSTVASPLPVNGGAIQAGRNLDLAISDCAFTNNTAQGVGGAIYVSDAGSGSLNIQNSRFTGNTSDGLAFSAGQGGAIYARVGASGQILGSTFTGNVVQSGGAAGADTGGALFVGGPNFTIRGNRIVDNTADAAPGAHAFLGIPIAENNWWGYNSSPTTGTPAQATGSLDAAPWLQLKVTPASPTVLRGGGMTLTGSITNAGYVPPNDGLNVSFDGGALGSVAPATALLSGGQATTNFTSGLVGGPTTITASYDHAVATNTVGVLKEPGISAASEVTFTVGTTATVSFDATGYPIPRLSLAGGLPAGLNYSFVGTTSVTGSRGQLFGTPAAGSGGRIVRSLLATNGVAPNASQDVTITIVEKPVFMATSSVTVTVGVPASIVVTATGFPTPVMSASGLPEGLSFADNGDGTGLISGTPSGPGGAFPAALDANNGISSVTTKTLSIIVLRAPDLTASSDMTFTAGAARTESVRASGNPVPGISMTGALPAGLSYTYLGATGATSSAGQISGTAAAGTGGDYLVDFAASNGVTPDATSAATVHVIEGPTFLTANATTFTVATPESFDVSTTAYPAAALSVTGRLPGGVIFTDNGDGTATFSGMPFSPGGVYPVTIRANNGVTTPVDQAFTLSVRYGPEAYATYAATFTVGASSTETFTANGYPRPTLSLVGALPSGLTTTTDDAPSVGATVSALGITGDPALGTGGTYALQMIVDGEFGTVPSDVSLTVVEAPDVLMSSDVTITAGEPASIDVSATGFPVSALSALDPLPTGLVLTDNGDGTAVIAGALGRKLMGDFPVRIQADNGVSAPTVETITIHILEAIPEWSRRTFMWDLQEDFEHNANTTGETVTVGGAVRTAYRPGSVVLPRAAGIAAGYGHTARVMSGGGVDAIGSNSAGQCSTAGWSDVVAISGGDAHTVGLRSDGTVVATGSNEHGQCNTSSWTSVTGLAVSSDSYHTAALKADGTVVATGNNNYGQCDTSSWTSITALATGSYHTVGLKPDGTVVAVGQNAQNQCTGTSSWTSITAVAAGTYHTVGLRADGSVVATGANFQGQTNTSSWAGVIAVAAGQQHTVGLRADGTVVATGYNIIGQCDTASWTDIVAIAAGAHHTVGLRSDGTFVATGANFWGQCDVAQWALGTAGTLGGSGTAVGLRAGADTSFAGWHSLISQTTTLVSGQSVKYGVRLSGDGVSWSEILGFDGNPIDWTTGSGNYLGRAYGEPLRSDLRALPHSRYIDLVVQMESSSSPELELQGVSVTYDRDDITPPTVTHDAPAGWRTSDFTVTVTATDTPAGVASLDVLATEGSPIITRVNTETVTAAISSEGTTTIEFSAIDDVDNRCTTQTATVRLDKSAPSLVISASPTAVELAAADTVSGIAGIWYRIDGGAPQLYTGAPFSPGGTGHHLISVWTLDVAGNLTVEVANVVVDTVAPEVWDDAPAGWRTSDVTVTLSASDDYSAIASLDWALAGASAGAGSVATGTAKVGVTAEGTTTIDYSAADTAGNRCVTETAKVRIDKTAPSTTATHAGGWVAGPVTVTLQPADAVSGVDSTWYRTAPAGAWQPYSAPFAVTEPGTTTVTFWSVDIAGNTESPQTTTVFVDDVDPAVSDDAPTGWQTADFTVNLSATDAHSGVAELDYDVTGAGGPASGSTAGAPAPIAITAEGTTTIDYSATDVAGNRCATETAMVRLDKAAPSTTATHAAGWSTTPVTVTLARTDAHSGVSSTWYRIGDGGTTLYTAPFAVSAAGETTVTFWSVDVAGNTESEKTTLVRVDPSAPTVSDDAPDAWQHDDVTVTITAADAISGVAVIDYTLSGSGGPGSGSIAGATAAIPVTAEGTTTIDYSATDASGRRSATETAQVRIDRVAPSSTASDAAGWSPNAVTVTLASTDAISGVDSIWYRTAPAGGWTRYTAPFEVTESGITTVTFWALDVSGLSETPKTTQVRIDGEGPTVSDDAPSGWSTTDVTLHLNATDANSGAASLAWQLSGATVSGGSVAADNAALPLSNEGTTTVDYSAADNAGNRCATETALVRIDKTAPSTTATHATGWQNAPVQVTLAATDAHSGVATTWYRLGDGGATLYAGPFSIAASGETTVTFWSVDTAGNTEGEQSTVVSVDEIAPVTTSDAEGSYLVGMGGVVHLSATDTVSGLAWTRWSFGTTSTVGTSVPVPAKTGTYDLQFCSGDVAGNVEATHTARFVVAAKQVIRIGGDDRFNVAVNAARRGWDTEADDSWPGVKHVIVANGENGREADPLSAAGLAGVYDAPILLTRASGLPMTTRAAIVEMAAANPGLKVHVVGGPSSVPEAVIAQLRSIPAVSSSIDRIGGADRYVVSANIATRMVSVVGTGAIEGVLFVCAEKPAAFSDALAVSPIAFSRQMPMIGVKSGSVPGAVGAFVASMKRAGKPIYLASGPTWIGAAPAVGAIRLTTSGNPYTASADIARQAVARGWSTGAEPGLAAKLPDALTGGTFIGKRGGVLLMTDSRSTMQPAASSYLASSKAKITRGWIFGGILSVPQSVQTQFATVIQ